MTTRFAGRRTAITGASRGIGAGIAQRLGAGAPGKMRYSLDLIEQWGLTVHSLDGAVRV